ncbi:2-amino-4-hydroxy-6-hydroxymethyldihydropteridine diphosphokinase [Aliikangiella sp. IMCC44632]
MKAFLGLGSNISPQQHIAMAKQALTNQYSQVRFSRSFKSKAVGFEGDDFINLVAEIETKSTLVELIEEIKLLEDQLGRVREGDKFSSRHIDIDILLYADHVCQQPIVLPRPEIRESAYVLWPLAELAPDLVEPGGSKSYAQLWQAFDAASQPIEPLD